MKYILPVSLAKHSYPIRFGGSVAAAVRELRMKLMGGGCTEALLTDAKVAAACARQLSVVFKKVPRLVLPAGESTKSLESLGRVLDFLAAERLGRDGVLWVVGGGVIGDLGGFAAAAYLRGIRFVQVPTTLLAMVDSSVGGKTGINLAAGKNLAGAFHHPEAVIIAGDFLRTLPAREFAAGMAEVIKYGLLGDAALFRRLERSALQPEHPALAAVIRRCCAMKAAIVRADERETAKDGGRTLLNLGHTFGHAIERVAGFGTYLHGEAVAVGLVAAARLSVRLGRLAPTEVARIERVLAAHHLPVRLRRRLPLRKLVDAMRSDKKVRGGRVRFVVLDRLGSAATSADVPPAAVAAVWRELGAV